ncbi:cytochrome P450 [Chroococcidiopsis sp. CCNUC1]|uniref:cytochrome P450 n=1 Tax=Chroococcidiopsis sp. CCNUC1 TaxID=2653189 RepID=UPI0020220306|nr:cytochrome P450 [Chroococcidiopsis sp. CCNUC1]URD53874.1 cytochrome P450 [Chroococcidiopsis sp. CCNUC1]
MSLPNGPNTPIWLQNMQLMSNPFGYLDRMSQQYGDIFTTAFGKPTIFVSHPQGLKEIFTNTKEITAPGEFNQTAAPVVGNNGLLLLSGTRHRQHRKLVMPAFHGTRIQTYGHRICDLTLQIFDRQAIGTCFTAYSAIETITLEVILSIVLGLQAGDRYEQFRQVLPPLLHLVNSPKFEVCLAFPALQRDLGKLAPWGYFQQLRRQFDRLLEAEIDDRRQSKLERSDVLSELLSTRDEAGQPLSNEEVRDLLPSLLFAGQDASATAVAWALYWVHRLPMVRDRLLQELASLGNTPNPLKIAQLPYLSAVCNEVLRIYPTQMFTFPRRVESPVEVMGHLLPPGTLIIGNIHLTHQRQDLYPEPNHFKPERFLERQFSAYEFLPFGGGSRVCIGAALAIFEMKLILATILSHYQLTLADSRPERPKRSGILFPPERGVKLIVTERRSVPSQPSIASLT